MASCEIQHLPTGFLDGPSPDPIAVHHIDFEDTPVPEYKDDYAVILDNVLSRSECKALIAGIESHCNRQWTRATVNTFGKGKALYSDVRSCGRIIWDSEELSRRLWERVNPHLPEIESLSNWPDVTGMGRTKRGELWKATRLNERMRFLKYTSGEFFRPHNDMTYETPDKKERSYFTLHLYLNDSESGEEEALSGGATTFHSWDMETRYDVEPKAGSVLVFQQRNLKHSGDDVKQGIKYSVRTDLMYTKDADVKVDAIDVSEGLRDKVKAKWSWIGKQ